MQGSAIHSIDIINLLNNLGHPNIGNEGEAAENMSVRLHATTDCTFTPFHASCRCSGLLHGKVYNRSPSSSELYFYLSAECVYDNLN
ncbi:hypothetical protein J6590_016092 [Homalodisca vitripennis]|nr:hypothetical protein J6590_016092 [Homalodisca vitripennis]